jgi:hypothetical protein
VPAGQEALGRLIDSALHAAERGGRLTGQLLAFSRRQQLLPVPTDFTVSVLTLPGQTFNAKVSYVGSALDGDSRRLLVRAVVDNRDGLLKPEMFAQVRILTGETAPSLAVPREAVIHEGDATRVWIMNADGSAELRSFKAGLQDRAERLQAELQSPGPLTGQGTRLNRGEFGRIFSGWYWTLEQDGRLQQSRSVWDDSLELDDARPWPRHKGSETLLSLRGPQGRELLGLRRSFDVAGRRVQLHVFGPLDGTRQEWRRIDRILLVTELGLVAALLLCTVALVRLGLQPLRSLQQALQALELTLKGWKAPARG